MSDRAFNVYKHLKSGGYYVALVEQAKDCTNARDCNTVVVYRGLAVTTGTLDGPVFVRDRHEFHQKFKVAGRLGLPGDLLSERYTTARLPTMYE
jgi:hypothetical protein